MQFTKSDKFIWFGFERYRIHNYKFWNRRNTFKNILEIQNLSNKFCSWEIFLAQIGSQYNIGVGTNHSVDLLSSTSYTQQSIDLPQFVFGISFAFIFHYLSFSFYFLKIHPDIKLKFIKTTCFLLSIPHNSA